MRFLLRELLETYRFRYVVYSFVSTSLKQRYRRSFIGFGWSLLGPILNYGVIAVVFKYTMRFAIPNYLLFMFSGAIIFNFLSASINRAPGIFFANEAYIKKIYIPKLVYILVNVLSEFINFVLSFVALMLFGIIFGKVNLSFSFFYLLYPALLGVFFCVGLSIIVSILTVYLRDVMHILPVVMQAAFFGTPIMYHESMLPEFAQKLMVFNPFFYFVESYRAAMYSYQIPSVRTSLILLGVSLLTFFFGVILLKKYDNRIVFKL